MNRVKGLKRLVLTPQQILFVQIYVVTGNIIEAIRGAKISVKNELAAGHRLLRNQLVIAEIARVRSHSDKLMTCTFEQIVSKLLDHIECSDREISIRAIAELNRMKGFHAPAKTVNLNIDVTIETLDQLGIEYKYS